PPLRPRARTEFADRCLAKAGCSAVGRVLEDAPYRGPVPVPFALGRRRPLLLQAAANLARGATLLAHPGEDLADDPRLLQEDLVARLARASLLAEVAVAVGRPAQHVDVAAPGRVQLAAAAALEDLGPFVLG